MAEYKYGVFPYLLMHVCVLPEISGSNVSGKSIVNVQKCCFPDELVNFYNPQNEEETDGYGFCMPNKNLSSGWQPRFHDQNLNRLPDYEHAKLDVRFQHNIIDWYFDGDSRCPEVYRSSEPYRLLKNGSLYLEGKPATDNYCIDHVLMEPGKIETVLLRCTVESVALVGKEFLHERNISVIRTTTNTCMTVKHGQVVHYIFKFLMVTSIIFLIITFVVYILVPDLKNLHGKIVVSNVMSIFLFSVYLLVVYIFKFDKGSLSCVVFGYIGYFLLISMFGWLTIMCFDLCWTFLRTKAPKKGGEVFKFTLYAVFVYSKAIILTITVFLFDHFHPEESLYDPKVGAASCFIQPEAMGMFVHLPILIIMIANSVLYIVTTTTLYRTKASTKGVRNSRVANSDYGALPNDQNKTKKKYIKIQKDTIEQLVLYTKLFLVMGVLWICETIHFFIHRCHDDNSSITPSEIFFRIIDAINLLRGFIFFLIFVCKADILKKLRQVPIFVKVLGRQSAGTSSGSTSTITLRNTAKNRSMSLGNSSYKSNQKSVIGKSTRMENIQCKETSIEDTCKQIENPNQPKMLVVSKHVTNNGRKGKTIMENSKDILERESFFDNQCETACI